MKVKIWDNHNNQWLEPVAIYFGNEGVWQVQCKKKGDDPINDGWYTVKGEELKKIAIVGDINYNKKVIPNSEVKFSDMSLDDIGKLKDLEIIGGCVLVEKKDAKTFGNIAIVVKISKGANLNGAKVEFEIGDVILVSGFAGYSFEIEERRFNIVYPKQIKGIFRK